MALIFILCTKVMKTTMFGTHKNNVSADRFVEPGKCFVKSIEHYF